MPINPGSGEYEPTPETGHRVVPETKIAKYLCPKCGFEATPGDMDKLDPRFGLVCPRCAPAMLEKVLSGIVMRPVTVAIPVQTPTEATQPLIKKPVVDERNVETKHQYWNPRRRRYF